MKPKIPAAVSAQRMGKIVVNEAQQEADRLTTQAQQTAAICPSWSKSQARSMSRRGGGDFGDCIKHRQTSAPDS